MTTPDLQALACEDCPAAVHHQTQQGLDGPVLVVAVTHAGTCPWAARYVPADGYVLAVEGGLLRHEITDE